MAEWPLGKLEGIGIMMRLETILSQAGSFGKRELEGAETKWLWVIPCEKRDCLRYSPVPPERVCVFSHTCSNDMRSKMPH